MKDQFVAELQALERAKQSMNLSAPPTHNLVFPSEPPFRQILDRLDRLEANVMMLIRTLTSLEEQRSAQHQSHAIEEN
jgi:hypothetical protein